MRTNDLHLVALSEVGLATGRGLRESFFARYMPYHVEHHAWPNVPFHKLEAAHTLVKDAYKKQGVNKVPTGCSPSGEQGYLALHWSSLKGILNRKST